MSPSKKYDGVEYFGVQLFFKGFGNDTNSIKRKMKTSFQISLLDVDGRPGEVRGKC